MGPGVYEITVFDENWRLISKDYKRFEDRQQAEITAEADATWLGCDRYEIRKIR